MKRWKERYVSFNIRTGVVRVWVDKPAMLRGDTYTEQIQLTTTMALSPMKVATNTGTGNARIFYRHIADVKNIIPTELLHNSSLTSNNPTAGTSTLHIAEATKQGQRIFKFGCSSQKDFEVWSKVFRSSIDTLITLEKTIIETHDAFTVGNRINSTELMKLALRSPNNSHSDNTTINNINDNNTSTFNSNPNTTNNHSNHEDDDPIMDNNPSGTIIETIISPEHSTSTTTKLITNTAYQSTSDSIKVNILPKLW